MLAYHKYLWTGQDLARDLLPRPYSSSCDYCMHVFICIKYGMLIDSSIGLIVLRFEKSVNVPTFFIIWSAWREQSWYSTIMVVMLKLLLAYGEFGSSV